MKIFGIAGWSGSGKTTLLVRLLPEFVRLGIEVATVKHTHHNPALGDAECRALAAAGVTEMVMASPRRFALLHELAGRDEPGMDEVVSQVGGVDLVLVEGFKFAPHPKLEVWDPTLGKPMLAPGAPSVVAIASDDPAAASHGRPRFRRDDTAAIARFILDWH